MKADIKPKNKVRPIWTVYCLNHIFLKLLWVLNSKNIATHFIMWHHICSSSAKWWIIAFVGSSYSVLTPLETTCHKWLNCLFVQVSYWAGASFTQPYGKKSFGVIFIVSSVNAYSEWIRCMEALMTCHMYLFWHGRVWRHQLRHRDR